MRKTFIEHFSNLAEKNQNLQILLGDISVFQFKKNNKLPSNIHNMGILEQSMIGFGAGLSAEGLYPVMHTISPFIVERAFEQIKVNFCLNNLPGLFITVGGVCDYYSLGRTHHSPNDISILSTLPNIEFACPTNDQNLIEIIDDALKYRRLIYIRLTENFLNPTSVEKKFNFLKDNSKCQLFCGELPYNQVYHKNADRIFIESSLDIKSYDWKYDEIHVFEPSIGASFSNRLRKYYPGRIISYHLNSDGPKSAKSSFKNTRKTYEYL